MRRVLFLTATAIAALLANDASAVRLASQTAMQVSALQDKPAAAAPDAKPAAPDAKPAEPKKEEIKSGEPSKPSEGAKPAEEKKDGAKPPAADGDKKKTEAAKPDPADPAEKEKMKEKKAEKEGAGSALNVEVDHHQSNLSLSAPNDP